MDAQPHLFRLTNTNAPGQARSLSDHQLWHHAIHTVGLFACQCNSPILQANAVQAPIHLALGVAMHRGIQRKAATGASCTLSLSFNKDGPLDTFLRSIGDTATYRASAPRRWAPHPPRRLEWIGP